MNPTFDKLYRQLGKATTVVLFVALTFFGLALAFALLGFPHAVVSFRGGALSAAYVFLVLFALFLVASLVALAVRRVDHRNPARIDSADAGLLRPDKLG
jgi:sterol desaturase/sphingolipid hydroxylase (fatty acid hydroxylase superfamily)